MQLKKNKGMTIVEILVASLILSIVLMGYIQTQMRSIINTEYSNKANMISSANNDFSALFRNFLVNGDEEATINMFKSGNWDNTNYSNDLKDCENTTDIDDTSICDDEKMIHYIIKEYKEDLKMNIPDALFSFNDCQDSDNLCLIVAWSQSMPTEDECNIETESCFIMEIKQW